MQESPRHAASIPEERSPSEELDQRFRMHCLRGSWSAIRAIAPACLAIPVALLAESFLRPADGLSPSIRLAYRALFVFAACWNAAFLLVHWRAQPTWAMARTWMTGMWAFLCALTILDASHLTGVSAIAVGFISLPILYQVRLSSLLSVTLPQLLMVVVFFALPGWAVDPWQNLIDLVIFAWIGWFVHRHVHTQRFERWAARRSLEAVNAELSVLSLRDPLTGLSNRRHIQDMAEKEWARTARYGAPFSILLFDLDHFKHVNDESGHAAGDAVLVGFAQLLEAGIRRSDLCGRWGGEEFVVLLTNTTVPGSILQAERIRQDLADFQFPEHPHRVTASVGIALSSEAGTFEEVLQLADRRLYRAKAEGRDRACGPE